MIPPDRNLLLKRTEHNLNSKIKGMEAGNLISARPRIDALQGLRAIAFLCIFFFHCFLKDTDQFTYGGAFGTSVFFAISGFGLYYNHAAGEDNGAGTGVTFGAEKLSFSACLRFAWKRLGKLYLLYFAMLLVAVPQYVLQMRNAGFPVWQLPVDFILEALMLQAFVPLTLEIHPLVPSFWYMSALLVVYILFPWTKHRLEKLQKRGISGIAVTGCCVIILVLTGLGIQFFLPVHAEWLTYYFPLLRWIESIGGCGIAMWVLERRKGAALPAHLPHLAACALLAVMLMVHLLLLSGLLGGLMETLPNLATDLFNLEACMLIALLADGEWKRQYLTSVLGSKPLIFFGNLSGILYLLHGNVIRYTEMVLWHVIGEHVVYTMLKGVTALVITIAAAFAYKKIFHK